MRAAPDPKIRVPPLTHESMGYQACINKLLPREFPVG